MTYTDPVTHNKHVHRIFHDGYIVCIYTTSPINVVKDHEEIITKIDESSAREYSQCNHDCEYVQGHVKGVFYRMFPCR